MDPFAAFKNVQKQGWAHFAPLEAMTAGSAARLVRHARIQAGQRVLDVACGTGVVSITAARQGARVTGLDLTPELIARARENAALAKVTIDFHEGDAEALPFPDATFDAVVSQFGHMFAPRPEVVVAEMLRVLKPGGTIAFSTWPPELFIGKMFALVGRYAPPPPPGVAPPPQWGNVDTVRERLGSAVKDVAFDRAMLMTYTLSPQHQRDLMERTSGPVRKLVENLSQADPAKLETFRREYEELVEQFFEDNMMRQDYLMTRGTKV